MSARDPLAQRSRKVPEGRRLPRLRTELITCELGEVIDLSLVGFCVRTTRPMNVGEVCVLFIRGFDKSAGPLQTSVIWCDHGNAGLRITKAAKAVRRVLSDIAMMARDRAAFDRV